MILCAGETDGCVFCSIVEGAAPAERIFEDEATLAIMDIAPATDGHVLVIPRAHSNDLWEISLEEAQRAMAVALKVARMIRAALAPAGINLIHATGRAAWQTIFHFHIHVVPRYEGDVLVPPWTPQRGESDLVHIAELASRIRAEEMDERT